MVHADRLKARLGPPLKSWIVEREGTVTQVEPQVVRAVEVGPASGYGEAVPGKGTSDGSDAMKSLNPLLW